MKRKHVFYFITILAVLIIIIYLQCQGKKGHFPPPQKMAEPVHRPSEFKSEIPGEPEISAPKESPPEDKPVKPEKEDLAISLEKQIVTEAEKFSKPALVPGEEQAEETMPPGEELKAVLPEVPIEKPSEAIPALPEKTAEEVAARETLPELQIDQDADPARRVIILPFDNLTDNAGAVKGVLPWIKSALAQKGYAIIDETLTSDILCREGIRLATDLPGESTRAIGKTLRAGTILAGTVFAYKADSSPRIGISARLIDSATGAILWANYASDTGEDFTGLLGLGTITSLHALIPRVVNQLLGSFRSAPPETAPESMYRVVVLPFQNLSKDRHAGMAVTQLFLVELYKNALFDPVEYGDVRKMIVDMRVRHKGELSYERLDEISRALGAGIILTGTVEDFSEGIANAYPPKVAVSARLLDSSRNKIVWFNTLALDGEDKITAFEWGKMRSPDKVAYAVVSDLVKSMEKTPWH